MDMRERWAGRQGEGNGAKSCCLGGGLGTPHRDSWPSGRGAFPWEESKEACFLFPAKMMALGNRC